MPKQTKKVVAPKTKKKTVTKIQKPDVQQKKGFSKNRTKKSQKTISTASRKAIQIVKFFRSSKKFSKNTSGSP
jgi:hypothetical protein